MIVGMVLMAGAAWFLLSRVKATDDFAREQTRTFCTAVQLAITEHRANIKKREVQAQATTVSTRQPVETPVQEASVDDDIQV